MGFGLRTGCERLFQADGPAVSKARRSYLLVGDVERAVDISQLNGDVCGWTAGLGEWRVQWVPDRSGTHELL